MILKGTRVRRILAGRGCAPAHMTRLAIASRKFKSSRGVGAPRAPAALPFTREKPRPLKKRSAEKRSFSTTKRSRFQANVLECKTLPRLLASLDDSVSTRSEIAQREISAPSYFHRKILGKAAATSTTQSPCRRPRRWRVRLVPDSPPPALAFGGPFFTDFSCQSGLRAIPNS